METKKITKREHYATLIELISDARGAGFVNYDFDDLASFIANELELLDKKASKSGESKSKKENEELMNILYDELVGIGKAVTITEFMKASPTVAERELSNQKITSLFTKMKGERVDKVVLKGKAYYSAI